MRVLDSNLIRVTDAGWDLVGQKCAHCGKIAFPRKRVCPECFGEQLDEHILSRHGTLHTYTCTHLGPPGMPSPYLLGFLDLPEGIKLMGQIITDTPWEQALEVGMPMDIVMDVLRQDASGEDIHCYKFRPARGPQ